VNPRRLYRSAEDRWIAGVAAGVADYFDVDPILVRIVWLVSLPLTGFFSLLAYIIMIVVVPLGPQEWSQPSPWQPGGAPVGYGAPSTPPAAPAGGAAGPVPDPASGAPQGAPAPGPTPGWDWRWQARQDRWQRRAERWEHRAERHGSGGLVFGALLIVVGGVLAWHTIDPGLDLNLAWAIAIIVFGVFLVISSVERHGGA
jgi:phage shock protein PspC (stress-responsive transcriptional regulator)